jgi:hypothetical protein
VDEPSDAPVARLLSITPTAGFPQRDLLAEIIETNTQRVDLDFDALRLA